MSTRRRTSRRQSRLPLPTSATWIAARASNGLRRPMLIASVSVVSFAISLLALVIVPQQARRAAAAITSGTSTRPDTESSLSALVLAERQFATASTALAVARADVAQSPQANATTTLPPSVSDTLSPGARSRRDTLTSQVTLLGRLITRSENAPLLGSYRALAQAPPMQGDVRVRQLLDSLVEIERERDSYSAVGGVDPVFVALTARANELGRSIEILADTRRSALRREIAVLVPSPAPAVALVGSRAPRDTIELLRKRDAARALAAAAVTRLARERAELIRLGEREERARELASVGASPQAMLAAAMVFGAMFGFGVALLDEVRHPRIANAREVERATGIRVLGVIRPLSPSLERGRRLAERSGPAYIDSGAGGHQLIYQAIATAGVGTVMLSVTGDNPAVCAVVAINFSAIASDEARATLLLDTDFTSAAVMAALRLRPGAGLTELARGSARWSEVTRVAQLGRDRSIDVVPSGEGQQTVDQLATLLHRDAAQLARQYDAIVIVSAIDQVTAGLSAALPVPDVILCGRVGHTTIAALKKVVSEIKDSGAQARGIVLWNAPDPILADLRPMEGIAQSTIA